MTRVRRFALPLLTATLLLDLAHAAPPKAETPASAATAAAFTTQSLGFRCDRVRSGRFARHRVSAARLRARQRPLSGAVPQRRPGPRSRGCGRHAGATDGAGRDPAADRGRDRHAEGPHGRLRPVRPQGRTQHRGADEVRAGRHAGPRLFAMGGEHADPGDRRALPHAHHARRARRAGLVAGCAQCVQPRAGSTRSCSAASARSRRRSGCRPIAPTPMRSSARAWRSAWWTRTEPRNGARWFFAVGTAEDPTIATGTASTTRSTTPAT